MAIDYTSPNTPIDSPTVSPEETIKSMDDLNALRRSLKTSVEEHLKSQLSGTAQAEELINHPKLQTELIHIIAQATRAPQPNNDSLTKTVADSLINAKDRRLRLAISQANAGDRSRPLVDVLQHAMSDGSQNQTAALKSPLQVGANNLPTIEPIIQAVVGRSQNSTDEVEQKREIDSLHQELLAEALIGSPDISANVANIVNNHHLNISPADLKLLVAHVAAFQETIAANSDTIAKIQAIAQSQQISGKEVFQLLRQNSLTPQDYIHNLQSRPEVSPQPMSQSDQSPVEAKTLSSTQLRREMRDVRDSPSPYTLPPDHSDLVTRRFHLGFNQIVNRAQAAQQRFGQIRRIVNFFRQGLTRAPGGGFSFNLGNAIKAFGSSPGGGGGLLSTLKGLSNTGLGGLSKMANLGKIASLGSKIASLGKALALVIASAEVWVPLLIIGVVVLIVVLVVVMPGPTTQLASNLSPVGGRSGDYSQFDAIVCSDVAQPLTVQKPANSLAARAWEIVNNLEQGIWCYWNKSPDYPNLFDSSLDPNIDPSYCYTNGCNIFWCTYLVIKSYVESGVAIHPSAVNSRVMEEYFQSQSRYVSANIARETNIPIGSVVFFRVNGGPDRTNHVAIVVSVNQDGVTYVQSNAASKQGFIGFNESGVGIINPGWATITGFGTP
jgi:hypothetical protein